MVFKYLFTRPTLKQVLDNGDFDYDTVLFVQAHIKQSWFLWNGSDKGGGGNFRAQRESDWCITVLSSLLPYPGRPLKPPDWNGMNLSLAHTYS